MSNIPNVALDSELPNARDIERTLLGAVLKNNAAWEQIRPLGQEDWYLDSHRRIRMAMKRLADAGQGIDEKTLSDELDSRHELESVGGMAYIMSLSEGIYRNIYLEDHIRIVRNKSVLRQLMLICSQTIARAADHSEAGLEVTAELMSNLEKLMTPSESSNKAPVANFIVDALEEINQEYAAKLSPCIPSGNAWFDAKTGGGYRHGKITLVCARPNVGKTPWAVMSTATNCKSARKVVFFSLEMEKNEVLKNLVPYVVDLPNVVVNRPWLQTPEQNRLVNEAMNTIVEWPLSVYDGDMDCDEICWTIDQETRKGEEVLFILDHFGLIGGGSSKARDTRERYNDNSSRLRRKIKHKKSALLILCQLRKVNREFAEKPPVPDDVKESGNMWEDAFAGLLIHRPYEKETMKMSKEAELNLAKLRIGGSPGTVKGTFNTRMLRFEAEAELEYGDGSYYE